MLWPKNMLFSLIRSDSGMYAPSLAGFNVTPPRFTSSVSSIGVNTRLALPLRSSWLSLSPTSVLTAIIAVAMLIPSAMASSATPLRRFWRRNDSNTRRRNMMLPGELCGSLCKIGAGDDRRGAVAGCVERKRITTPGLAHTLRINRRRAVLANQSIWTFVKTDGPANPASVKNCGDRTIGLAVAQETRFGALAVDAVPAELAHRQIGRGNGHAAFLIKSATGLIQCDLRGGRQSGPFLRIDDLRRHHKDKDKRGSANQPGPEPVALRRPL